MTDLLIQQLYIGYKKRPVLNIESLHLSAHSCTVLSGGNGSGKTTLLKILAGLLKPQQATFIIQGKTLYWRQVKPLLQRHNVYVHQQPYLFDSSVSDNIAYGLRHQGLSRAVIHSKVVEALDWAGLSHLAKRHACTLSGGEKQRVALARAHILSPQFLLLDEPTASMDKAAKAQTYELIERLRQEPLSIILTSHELQENQINADRYLLIENGQIVCTDNLNS